jgi:HAD superfamily hydrolase (TIGR01490 family)
MKKQLAIFDFDGTITRKDTFILFALFAVGRWKFAKALLQTLPWLIGWKLHINSSSLAKERLFAALFKGMAVSAFTQLGEAFAEEIDTVVNEAVMPQMIDAKNTGKRIIIATASIDNWVKPWAYRHGFNEVVATQVEVVNNKLTGRFLTKNCIREEKVRRLMAYVGDISEYELFVWGNLPDDAPILAIADSAVVV